MIEIISIPTKSSCEILLGQIDMKPPQIQPVANHDHISWGVLKVHIFNKNTGIYHSFSLKFLNDYLDYFIERMHDITAYSCIHS